MFINYDVIYLYYINVLANDTSKHTFSRLSNRI